MCKSYQEVLFPGFPIVTILFLQVSYNEGLKVSKKIGTFIEVSAKNGENLDALFEQAIRVAINKPKKGPTRHCKVL